MGRKRHTCQIQFGSFNQSSKKNIDCKNLLKCNSIKIDILLQFFFQQIVYTISPMRLQALSPQRQQEKANWVPSTLTFFCKKIINWNNSKYLMSVWSLSYQYYPFQKTWLFLRFSHNELIEGPWLIIVHSTTFESKSLLFLRKWLWNLEKYKQL